jgi:lysyl-tRNA synthetase class 2
MSVLNQEASERERRLAKLHELRERGIDPYPATFLRDHALADVRELGAEVRVAGRVMLIRRHGGLIFATLADQTGNLQLLASRETLGEDAFAEVEALDRGDWVGVRGSVISTHTGELTVDVSELQLLSKALRALPDKHRGLTDTETRLRERYLDLLSNPGTRRRFDVRSAVVAAVRVTLAERGFTEVETPVLESQAGGAAARPFATHHNALDTDMYLRIALELPLKRLVVGGFERVFELGRVFRNEGVDPSHNPEFTLLEAYQALADYRDMMELVETIVSRAALDATGSTVVGGIDLAPPWRRATMAELIVEHAGEHMHPSMPLDDARAICDRLGIPYEQAWGAGKLMATVFEATAERTLIEPTFVLDHPREISPLAKAHRDDPELTERFEAFVGGRELANAYSELNDPVDQRERFEAEGGAIDEDYVRALEYGLPPTAGLGIGIDRLVMLIAGVSSIREAILFPALKPEGPAAAAPAPPPVVAAAVEPEPVAKAPRSRAPGILGALTALAGVWLMLAHLVDRHGFLTGHVTTVVAGFGLLVVAVPLRRGKRRAWGVATALFAIATPLRGLDPVAAAMLVALVWNREAFVARPDPGSLLDVARFLPFYAAAVAAVGGLTHAFVPELFTPALLAVVLAGLAILGLLAFRAVRAGGAPAADECERARELVRAHGCGTLDYFALRPDKSYFFSRTGDAMLAYRFLAGHALVAGDPIGAPGSHDRLVGEFMEHCRVHGWRVAFLGARERDLAMYRRHGLRGIYLGDEAVVHCDTFSLSGSAMKSVRSAVSRVGRECTFRLLREPEASPALRAQLNELRERWREGEDERGFTMELGGGVRGEDPELLLAVAFAGERPLGFLRLVPCFGDDAGWSLDLMQHDPDAPNGMTEYLIAMAAQELGKRGYRRLSLNFATWGRLFSPDARLTPAQRGQRKLAQVLSPYFQITSLRNFNAKFDPQWVPRAIVVEDLEDAPRVGLLYALVEGFVRVPLIGSRLVPVVGS